MAEEGKTFLFLFPLLPGHINPSFPVARALISRGHKVHYICRPVMRDAIEATGATFHDDETIYTSMYTGRKPDPMGFGVEIKEELGVPEGFMRGIGGTKYRLLELKLESLVPFIKELSPVGIMYCPMLCEEGAYGGKIAGIPHVSLNTVAGPGALRPSYLTLLQGVDGIIDEELHEFNSTFAPRLEAMARLTAAYKVEIPDNETAPPLLGMLPCVLQADTVSLVTTIDALMEPMTPELARFYEDKGVKWEGVGPLLDIPGGARGAAAMRKAATDELHAADPDGVLDKVRKAKRASRPVILVSMGTLVTGDDPDLGWESQKKAEDGQPQGLMNKEVVRSAWGAVFDAAGKPREHSGPLIVVSLGIQRDALGELEAPANSICQQSVPQVEILREGVDCFVMGGGQNGFQEGLINGAPFVVVPVVSDQVVQGGLAQSRGFGVTVARPDPNPGEEEEAKATYRTAIAVAVEEVLSNSRYMETVAGVKQQFEEARGVERVLEALGC